MIVTFDFPPASPMTFLMKLHQRLWNASRKSGPVAKHLNCDHVVTGALQQLELQGPIRRTICLML